MPHIHDVTALWIITWGLLALTSPTILQATYFALVIAYLIGGIRPAQWARGLYSRSQC